MMMADSFIALLFPNIVLFSLLSQLQVLLRASVPLSMLALGLGI
jgi:hypothetical protein